MSQPDPYRRILEHLPIAIYNCDAGGYVQDFNAAAVALWGEAPGRGIMRYCGARTLLDADGRPFDRDEHPVAKLLRGEPLVETSQLQIVRPDGTTRLVNVTATPLSDIHGSPTGAVVTAEDLTPHQAYLERTAHLAAIVETSDDAIISKTTEGIITSWNKAASRMFGYSAGEMVGQSVLKLIPEDRQHEEPFILQRLSAGEKVDHFVTRRVTKDGRLLDVSLTMSPIKDAEGRVRSISKIARDITAQRIAEDSLRESEARFRMALAATNLGTWEYEPGTGALTWSEECRAIYQVPADIQPGFDMFTRLLHPDDRDEALSAISRALDSSSGGDYNIRFRVLRYSDRAERWIHSQGKVFFDTAQKPVKFIGTVMDITDEQQRTVALEEKIAERTADLLKANLQLAHSNRELEHFAFVASHDLQEPLRKIIAFGGMLRKVLPEGTGDAALDYLRRMDSAAERMKLLIDNLLSYSRIGQKERESRSLNPGIVIQEVLSDLETAIRETGAEVQVEKLFPVRGDASQIRQLFQNLLANALKFSRPGVPPLVTISSVLLPGEETGLDLPEAARRQSWQRIAVEDNGIGFEQEYAEKIFGLFQRLHGQQEYGGSGIGLSIVEKVMEQHGGFVRASGVPGKGAAFYLFFPAEA